LYLLKLSIIVCLVVCISSCIIKTTDQPHLKRVSPDNLPKIIDKGNLSRLKTSIDQALIYLSKIPPTHNFHFGNRYIDASQLKTTLEKLRYLLSEKKDSVNLSEELSKNFDVYTIKQSDNIWSKILSIIWPWYSPKPTPTLVTGYFQPLIDASYVKTSKYTCPIYARPKDLVQAFLPDFNPNLPPITIWGRLTKGHLVPYYSRKEIEQDKLCPARVLAWLKSPITVLMLQIQGSAVLKFPDGSRKFIHYAASNGLEYKSVGAWLIENGYLKAKNLTWQAIASWGKTHPLALKRAIFYNPRFIFFKWEKHGPLGSTGVTLVPMRSVALDNTIFPPTMICFLKFKSNKIPKGVHNGFVINLDTGAAIKGYKRVDLYCGEGAIAKKIAGSLKAKADIFFFLPKGYL